MKAKIFVASCDVTRRNVLEICEIGEQGVLVVVFPLLLCK